ncbi:MAG: serine protease [Planctomycetaceae bacterium]|nr:serine protease [Planctomycetaceae bacterium]
MSLNNKLVNSQLARNFLLLASILLFSQNAQAQSTSAAISNVQPRLVKIFGAGGVRGLHAYSTGFLVSSEGHIATVWSHVLDADEVSVVLNDGRRFMASVLGAEPQLDLAVLKIRLSEDDSELDLPHFNLKQVGTASAGTRILGFSNMFNVAAGDEPVSVLHGVVMAKTKLDARRGSFEVPFEGAVYIVDAITNNSGAAGGALTDRSGKLLGMIGKELRNSKSNTWVNYAVPMTDLGEPIEQMISGNFENKPRRDPADNPNRYRVTDFGIVMVPDVIFRTPAYVDSIAPNSAASKVGLRPDDLVLFVNDELIQSVRVLSEQMGYLESGDVLRLVVRRNDQLVTVEMLVPKKEQK